MREMFELTLKSSEPLNKGGFVSASVNKETRGNLPLLQIPLKCIRIVGCFMRISNPPRNDSLWRTISLLWYSVRSFQGLIIYEQRVLQVRTESEGRGKWITELTLSVVGNNCHFLSLNIIKLNK